MNGAAYFKTICDHCRGHIEYPSSGAGEITTCPHCGQQTLLPYVPANSPMQTQKSIPPSARTTKSGKSVSNIIAWSLLAVIFGGLALLEVKYSGSENVTWGQILSTFLSRDFGFSVLIFLLTVVVIGVPAYIFYLIQNSLTTVQKQNAKLSLARFVCGAIILLVAALILERIFLPSLYYSFKADVVGIIDNQPYRLSVDNYLRAHANNPGSVSIVSLNPAAERAVNGTLQVDCHFRAKNGFGALVLDSETFTVDANNNVINATANQ